MTLAGTVLVTVYGQDPLLVFASVILGSLVGSSIAYRVGVLLERRSWPGAHAHAFLRKMEEGARKAASAFSRYGAVLILINRFMPGIRAFFFVAAGLARMPFGLVLIYALVSAAAWNFLLLMVGIAVGKHIHLLERLFETYQIAIWTIFILVFGLFLLKHFRKSRTTRQLD